MALPMRQVVSVLSWAYFVRFALAALLLLACFPWIALRLFPNMLRNVVVDLEWDALFWVSLAATLTSAIGVAGVRLVSRLGAERFGDSWPAGAPSDTLPWHWAGALALTPLFWTLASETVVQSVVEACVWLAVGFASAIVLLILGQVLGSWLTLPERGYKPLPPSELVIPFSRIPLLSKLLSILRESAPPRALQPFQRWVRECATRVLPEKGYQTVLEPEGSAMGPGPRRFYPGHVFATAQMFVALMFYAALYRYSGSYAGGATWTPALLWMLAPVALGCWMLQGAAFFLDRYRFPVLVPLALVTFSASWFPQSDHFFVAYRFPKSPGGENLPTASQVLEKKGDRVILVSAEGGGIQAAAWTARVLTGLAQAVDSFSEKTALISSTSGGSVGALFYLDALAAHRGCPSETVLETAFETSMASSLADTAWGWFGPDLVRTLFPWFPRRYWVDRGWALERSFARRMQSRLESSEKLPILRYWSHFTVKGEMPGFMFNSTLAESGEPLVFSNVDFEPKAGPVPQTFHRLYDDGFDVEVPTAARLSAAFPYVSPAAQLPPHLPVDDCNRFHVVDGGYYDNYGMMSLMAWLDGGLEARRAKALGACETPRRLEVLLLEIRPFPAGGDAVGRSRSWAYQLIAPPTTVLNVWSEGQKARNLQHLRLLERRWQGELDLVRHTVRFSPYGLVDDAAGDREDMSPPLSWKLRAGEKDGIRLDWGTRQRKATVACVKRFLERGPNGSTADCSAE